MAYDIQTEAQEQVPTGLKLNAKNFLLRSIEEINSSYDYAYPDGTLDEDKAHTALQEMKGQLDILTAFLENLQ
jgi:hypothetical protein